MRASPTTRSAAASRAPSTGTTSSYLYDGGNVVQDLSGGAPQADYLLGHGADRRYSRSNGNSTQSYLTDALGSTIALADGGGNVQTSYSYDPFGQSVSSGSPSSNRYQYTGRENDGTGLQYNRARYYSPAAQRFISKDPLGFSANGPNLYSYASDNPVNASEPSGRTTGEYHVGLGNGEAFYEASPEGANAGAGYCFPDCGSGGDIRPGERKPGPGTEICISILCWSPGEGFQPTGDPGSGRVRGWAPIPSLPNGGAGGVKFALSDLPVAAGPQFGG
jgi:RHS repeat-associated protein